MSIQRDRRSNTAEAYSELVGRLEKATGPDRKIDVDIDLAINQWASAREHIDPDTKELLPLPSVPHYTGSIDAARTLLPQWASFELTQSAAGPPPFTRARLWDWRRSPLMSDPGNEWKSEGNRHLATNICIAALKAIAAQGE